MRVVVAALGICAVAFLAGVAGDLSLASPPGPSAADAAESVTVRLPPNTVRAHPLPVAAVVSRHSHHHARARGHRKHRLRSSST